MLTHSELHNILQDQHLRELIDQVWNNVSQTFIEAQSLLPAEKAMPRKELSFHEQVKFLGYLCLLVESMPGDIIEIGVWKGKSLAFMNEMCSRKRKVIGIDPMELHNQAEELIFYHQHIFPEAILIQGYSEFSIERAYQYSSRIAILHIDGGHLGRNVLLDFLLYSPSLLSGGFLVFDDYTDWEYSPEVGPAVDMLRAGGYFKDFHIFGSVPGYANSYLLQKK